MCAHFFQLGMNYASPLVQRNGECTVFDMEINRKYRKLTKQTVIAGLCTLALAGCQGIALPFQTSQASESDDVQSIQSAVQATAAITQPKVKVVPTITGMGYASVSSQPAKSINQRRLMAIRAARLEAMRNLVTQETELANNLATLQDIAGRVPLLVADIRTITAAETAAAQTRAARTGDTARFQALAGRRAWR